jgi:hypothetical protein
VRAKKVAAGIVKKNAGMKKGQAISARIRSNHLGKTKIRSNSSSILKIFAGREQLEQLFPKLFYTKNE